MALVVYPQVSVTPELVTSAYTSNFTVSATPTDIVSVNVTLTKTSDIIFFLHWNSTTNSFRFIQEHSANFLADGTWTLRQGASTTIDQMRTQMEWNIFGLVNDFFLPYTCVYFNAPNVAPGSYTFTLSCVCSAGNYQIAGSTLYAYVWR